MVKFYLTVLNNIVSVLALLDLTEKKGNLIKNFNNNKNANTFEMTGVKCKNIQEIQCLDILVQCPNITDAICVSSSYGEH